MNMHRFLTQMWSQTARLLLCGILTFSALAEELFAPSKEFSTSVGTPLHNTTLPASINAPDGKLTLHADFAQAGGGKVPLYLINRTAEKVILSSQDGNIYLKLERKMPDGRWERVQIHQRSWCGNSYYPVALAPGHYFTFPGYMPTKGAKAQVRYRGYSSNSLLSNEGEGFFLEEDRIAASIDQLALRDLPPSLRPYFEHNPEMPREPFPGFTAERFHRALHLLSTYRESAYARRRTKAFLTSEIEKYKGTPQLASAIQEILTKQWPDEPSPESLFKAALAELPEHPIPAWSVINDYIQDDIAEHRLPSSARKQVAEELHRALLRNDAAESQECAKLISSSRFAGEYLDDAFLAKWIRSPHEALVRECANALAQRMKYDLLAKIGLELPAGSQIIILRALASSGARENERAAVRDPHNEEERKFWIKCATEQSIKTVRALYYIGLQGEYNRFNLSLHQPLREFLMREANTPSKEIDGWEIGQVVSFVGTWKRKEDVVIFRSLLTHPAYQRSETIKSGQPEIRWENRRYRVRSEARQILMDMGEKVPDDLVLEEEFIIR
jgi:hypothetical protein